MFCYLELGLHRDTEREGRKKKSNDHLDLGEMEACTKRTTAATKGLGQRDLKVDMKDCFIFDSWFYSNRWEEYIVDFGADMVVCLKPIQHYYVRIPLRIWKRIGQEFLPLC